MYISLTFACFNGNYLLTGGYFVVCGFYQDNSESSLATDDSTQPEVSQSCTRGRPLKRTEISSDSEDKPELASQKSLDGEDSASDKGSTMEETNSHLYQELLDAVLKMKDGNGRMVCELFLKVPPRQVS